MAGIYTVAELSVYLKNLFQQDFLLRKLRVRGEVSNVKYHSSGHIYFTLKDAGGALSAVMYANQRKGLSFRLQEGQKVVVSGSVEIYEKRGVYQLYAASIEAEGRGDLYAAFLRNKEALEEMGMFSWRYKKNIPFFASKIGIVTAPTGAAIQDIISIAKRRNPFVQLILYPALVQGEEAAPSIVRGIEALDRAKVDVIIVGRGGGSIEDLWAFNETEVAQAIFDCETPVISAVGHETDFTIADFVADLRAPTPSAAAEQAVLDVNSFLDDLLGKRILLKKNLQRCLERTKQEVQTLSFALRLRSPGHMLRTRRMHTEELRIAMGRAMDGIYQRISRRFEQDVLRLEALSPERRLQGGYAYVRGEDGRAVSSVLQLEQDQKVRLYFSDGSAEAAVLGVEPKHRVRMNRKP